jgi:hypothetical protein
MIRQQSKDRGIAPQGLLGASADSTPESITCLELLVESIKLGQLLWKIFLMVARLDFVGAIKGLCPSFAKALTFIRHLLELLLPRSCPDTFVMEGIVLVKLIHLQLGCTLPLVFAMKLVESDGIFITSRDLKTVHVLLAGLVGP